MPLLELKRQLAESLAKEINHPQIDPDYFLSEFTSPPSPELGHVALPCFRLAKILNRKSNEVAVEIAKKLTGDRIQGTAAGPYINFKWKLSEFYENVVGQIRKEGKSYGSDQSGSGQRVVFEYCSPNIAKKLAIHHIRSTLIGNVLANTFAFLGYKAHRINFVGDWGAQFARLLGAFELWGNPERLNANSLESAMDHLSEVYVRFHKEMESKPEYMDIANKALMRMESKEPRATDLWDSIRKISFQSMQKTLDRLGVRFDELEGESHYLSHTEKILKEVKTKAAARLSEGAWIVDVEGIDVPALIQKTDGTTLYLTRDICAAIDRYQRLAFSKMFYVVSQQQALHFRHLFGILKKMGFGWASHLEHISFGTVLFGSTKMSTRQGTAILLDDILDQAHAMALELCTEKNPSLENKEAVAEAVGVGAIIFGELASHKQRDIEFDWKQVLSFEGETGPYVQYALVRCRSLMKKATEEGFTPAPEQSFIHNYSFMPEEEALLLSLSQLRGVLHTCVQEREPFYLARYLIDLAKSFNRFYYKLPVLQATDNSHKSARYQLVKCTSQVLENGFRILGVAAPEEM